MKKKPEFTEEERQKGIDEFINNAKDSQVANKTASNSASASASIKIKRKDIKESKTLVGWRLNTRTVDLIKELAFESRMGINEFVQELLDKALEDIDIE